MHLKTFCVWSIHLTICLCFYGNTPPTTIALYCVCRSSHEQQATCEDYSFIFSYQRAIEEEVAKLPATSQSLQNSTEKVKEFARHVLNESCTTVTNTAAKTTVQLVFGKANLVSD